MKSRQIRWLDLELAKHQKSNQNRVVGHDDFDVSEALREALQSAKKQGRVICGINESAGKLRSEPESLMLCILPCITSSSDIVLQIHLTLIKAFCLEQDIKLIQIDYTEQLKKIISGGNCKHSMAGNDVTVSDESTDFNCVLIEHPVSVLSDAETRVLNFNAATCYLSPQPVVRLAADRLNGTSYMCLKQGSTLEDGSFIWRENVACKYEQTNVTPRDLKALTLIPADFPKTRTTSLLPSNDQQSSTFISPSSTQGQSLSAQQSRTTGRRRSIDRRDAGLLPLSGEGYPLTLVIGSNQRLARNLQ